MKVGGVLATEFSLATSAKSKIDGVIPKAFPIRSSLTITTVIPAGPMFFCAPANINPYFETSIGRDIKFEDMSQTNGTPFVSGTNPNSTPSTVSLSQ